MAPSVGAGWVEVVELVVDVLVVDVLVVDVLVVDGGRGRVVVGWSGAWSAVVRRGGGGFAERRDRVGRVGRSGARSQRQGASHRQHRPQITHGGRGHRAVRPQRS